MLGKPIIIVVVGTFAIASPAAAQSPALPPGPMQQKATTTCAECHDAGIMLQQRLNKKLWTREVDKMIRWGAVVAPVEREPLIDYFSVNFPPEKPPYEPPRPMARRKKPNP